MKEEVGEAYSSIHDSFWGGRDVDVRNIRVELIDVLHFLFTVSMSLGMKGEDLGKTYLDKREVNVQRSRNGKKEKGDDEHVGQLLF
jgi:dimeric dUTPase (all-alpha-NTP-PPase superfamily)